MFLTSVQDIIVLQSSYLMPEYTTAIDILSTGCVMAELLLGQVDQYLKLYGLSSVFTLLCTVINTFIPTYLSASVSW